MVLRLCCGRCAKGSAELSFNAVRCNLWSMYFMAREDCKSGEEDVELVMMLCELYV